MFWNLIRTTRGHVFKVTFGQNFQNSHQTDIPYRNGMRNLGRRDVCAVGKKSPNLIEAIERVRNIFRSSRK